MLKKSVLLILMLTSLLLAACGGRNNPETGNNEIPTAIVDTPTAAAAEPTPFPTNNQAAVDSVEILLLESFPVQVNAIARGNLPDSCTSISSITQERVDNTFTVNILTTRDEAAVCTTALVPFEQTISIDAIGLLAGNYTVTVNGVSNNFTLTVDNVAAAEPTENPDPEATGGSAISGTIWHDLCELNADGNPGPGCVDDGTGSYRAALFARW